MRKPKSPRELAARALCSKDGHPEDIKFEGAPMWRSYLSEVDIVLLAVGWPGLEEQRKKDWEDWQEAKQKKSGE